MENHNQGKIQIDEEECSSNESLRNLTHRSEMRKRLQTKWQTAKANTKTKRI